jgi:putative ABC transport system permease protein
VRYLATLLLMVRRSLRQHALSTLVTVLSVGLGVGLTISVFSVAQQTRDAFAPRDIGIDAVVGARGSPLQLVLNSVYHLETSPGNLPWKVYEELRKDPAVEAAVPYAVGDNYLGWRIVGTTPDLWEKLEVRRGERLRVQPGGRFFDPRAREAVIGATVAARTGLGLNATLNAFHGFEYDAKAKHDAEYRVVGVLEPTNTPSDRVVFLPIEGVWRMENHVLRGTGQDFVAKPGEAIPDEVKELSSVLVRFRRDAQGRPANAMPLAHRINTQGKVATMAWPAVKEIADFFDKLGWVVRILEMTAYLVVVVAAGSILASLYNTMNERRREFAILRALGARRRTVFGAIVLESTVIAGLGCVAGLLIHAALLAVAALVVRRATGVVLEIGFHPAVWGTPLAMTALGAVSGLLPAWNAYRTDVAENLSPSS